MIQTIGAHKIKINNGIVTYCALVFVMERCKTWVNLLKLQKIIPK